MIKLISIFSLLLLVGCADRVPPEQLASMEEVGFWHGLWHGLIILFALIGSFFDSSMTLFAAYNNGAWYNLGFVLGALGSGYAFFWGCVAGVGIFMAALYAALDYAERFFK